MQLSGLRDVLLLAGVGEGISLLAPGLRQPPEAMLPGRALARQAGWWTVWGGFRQKGSKRCPSDS